MSKFHNSLIAASYALVLTSAIGSAAAAEGQKDIVDTAIAAGDFETLAAALGAAGLVDTLKGEGPFTVFAPTDEAFAKLPAGTLEDLLKPENKDRLTAILTVEREAYRSAGRAPRDCRPYPRWHGARAPAHWPARGLEVARGREGDSAIALRQPDD